MAYIADRCQETCSAPGTGAVTLLGAVAAYQTFASGLGSTALMVGYAMSDATNWENGIGTFNGTTGLTRDTVLGSSNANALVNFTGTTNVWVNANARLLAGASPGRAYAAARGMARP